MSVAITLGPRSQAGGVDAIEGYLEGLSERAVEEIRELVGGVGPTE